MMEAAVSGFEHQVGGHFGLLQCEGHVAKPLDARELAFYKNLSKRFRKFAPAYCGTVRVRATVRKDGRLRLWSEVPAENCHPAPKPKKGSDDEKDKAVSLVFRVNSETSRVEVDVKGGTHHWAAECQLKVRMVGMQLYEEHTSSYSFVDKMEGRQMDETGFNDCIRRFVHVAGQQRAAELRKKLKELRVAMLEAEGYRFFSSSILIAFDADVPNSNLDLRMIDFAHSTFRGFFDDAPYENADDGYIKGIDSLLAVLKRIKSTIPEQGS